MGKSQKNKPIEFFAKNYVKNFDLQCNLKKVVYLHIVRMGNSPVLIVKQK